jgi:retron-type reverse transcriptase
VRSFRGAEFSGAEFSGAQYSGAQFSGAQKKVRNFRLTAAVDEKKMIDVIYFDLRKAFDKINLSILINKLKIRGITGDCLSWITNFITNRSVSVKIGNAITPPCTIHSGVPQGCTLSPLLFNIFLSDLASSFTDPNVTLKFFADDCKAYIIYDEKDMQEKKSSLIANSLHPSLRNVVCP